MDFPSVLPAAALRPQSKRKDIHILFPTRTGSIRTRLNYVAAARLANDQKNAKILNPEGEVALKLRADGRTFDGLSDHLGEFAAGAKCAAILGPLSRRVAL